MPWNKVPGLAFLCMLERGPAMDTFVCPKCLAQYVVVRRDDPADREPTCGRCDHPFPDEASGGGWLHYEPAKAKMSPTPTIEAQHEPTD
jgi:hypothetical protein